MWCFKAHVLYCCNWSRKIELSEELSKCPPYHFCACVCFTVVQTTLLAPPPYPLYFKEILQCSSVSGLPKIRYYILGLQLYKLASSITSKRILGQAMDQVKTLFNIFILRSLPASPQRRATGLSCLSLLLILQCVNR